MGNFRISVATVFTARLVSGNSSGSCRNRVRGVHTHKRVDGGVGSREPHGKIDSFHGVKLYPSLYILVVTAFGNYLAHSCTLIYIRALYAPRVARASDNLEACTSDKQGTRMYPLLPRYPATRIIQRPRSFPVPVLLFLRISEISIFSPFPSPAAHDSLPPSIDRTGEEV